MDKNNIPESLHYLIPTAQIWGNGDDGYRDEKIESSSNAELQELINNFSDEVTDSLNLWLGKPSINEPQTEEYHKFSSLFMAFEYAEAVLRDRIENKK